MPIQVKLTPDARNNALRAPFELTPGIALRSFWNPDDTHSNNPGLVQVFAV